MFCISKFMFVAKNFPRKITPKLKIFMWRVRKTRKTHFASSENSSTLPLNELVHNNRKINSLRWRLQDNNHSLAGFVDVRKQIASTWKKKGEMRVRRCCHEWHRRKQEKNAQISINYSRTSLAAFRSATFLLSRRHST